MMIDAVLPAAGRISGEFAAEAGAQIKTLIRIGGETVLERTVRTLRRTGRVRRIVAIGPDELHSHPWTESPDAILDEAGETGPENIIAGLDWLREAGGDAQRVLIVTTDLPFLSPEAINSYLDRCPSDAEVCAPLVEKERFELHYPGSTNLYVPLKDGHWTMGCAFLVDPGAVRRCRDVIIKAFLARKSQFGMARLLGVGFVLRFALGQLRVADIEGRCGKLLGCTARGVLECPPELAYDIDGIEEYRYALRATETKGSEQ